MRVGGALLTPAQEIIAKGLIPRASFNFSQRAGCVITIRIQLVAGLDADLSAGRYGEFGAWSSLRL